tara:strand:- start:1337 stop:1753 length:417 start_codon:yes stop_codon:yes gene_type:complete
MKNFNLTYAAFLFPAIPLMMLTFGNRWIAISKLIRQMHRDFIDKRKQQSRSAPKYLVQIKILSLRLKYVKYMQLFSGLAFIINLLTILFGMIGSQIAPYFFALALVIFSTALVIFLIEINLSSHALKTHLEDLEDKKN